MNGQHCRLYDERIVKNIMISAGLLALDYMKENEEVDEEELCEVMEINADTIIEDTLDEMDDEDPSFDCDSRHNAPDSWAE